MPWIDVGRHTFDLATVELVSRGVDDQEGDGVTVTLASGRYIDLAGEEARMFMRVFREYTAARPVRREGDPVPEGESVDELRLPDAAEGHDPVPAAGRFGPPKALG